MGLCAQKKRQWKKSINLKFKNGAESTMNVHFTSRSVEVLPRERNKEGLGLKALVKQQSPVLVDI